LNVKTTKFQLVVTFESAKALGLTIPPSLRVADGSGDRREGGRGLIT
jgi:hypothetical protein